MNIKFVWQVLVLGLMAILPFASAQESHVADVTLTVDNQGATAFFLSATTSPDVGELGADNADWTLTVGRRYRVLNLGGAVYHPLELRAGANVLLSQLETNIGSLEADAKIAFERDDESITFTLTPELAQVLTNYNCAYHAVMTGRVRIVKP